MGNSKPKERVAVYIDGSNFYNYLKDKEINFPKGTKFDFKNFVNYLVGNRECVSKRYYTGVFRNIDGTKKSEEL
ncbi:MAG: NYN domain-containing protein, partial [Nitrosopumilus sp.]